MKKIGAVLAVLLAVLCLVPMGTYGEGYGYREETVQEVKINEAIEAAREACAFDALLSGKLFDSLIPGDSCLAENKHSIFETLFDGDLSAKKGQSGEEAEESYLCFAHLSTVEELQKAADGCFIDYPIFSDEKTDRGEAKFLFEDGKMYIASGYPFWGWGGHTYFDFDNIAAKLLAGEEIGVFITRGNSDYPDEAQTFFFRMIPTENGYKAKEKPQIFYDADIPDDLFDVPTDHSSETVTPKLSSASLPTSSVSLPTSSASLPASSAPETAASVSPLPPQTGEKSEVFVILALCSLILLAALAVYKHRKNRAL